MRRIQIISSLFELLIPILLYFVWDWSLHFILIFIYFDILASLVLFIAKENKLKEVQRINGKKTFGNYLTYSLFVILALSAFELSIGILNPKINYVQSYWEFMMVREFGIPQIILLLPLIIVMNVQQYKTLFINLKLHEKLPLDYLQNQHKTQLLLVLLQGLFFLASSLIFPSNELLFLCIYLIVKGLSDLVLRPYLERKFIERFVTLQNERKGQY